MPGLCTTLNTTTAALYTSTFTNVTASIYIQFGATGLGENVGYLNFVSYSQYIAALTARAAASGNAVQAAALSALSTYAAPIYGNGQVEISTALGRSLGFTGTAGITATLGFCTTPGTTAGCYDGVMTITNDPDTPQYYRVGTEAPNQYDFFSTVEHETDEILGTASCIDTTTTPLSNDCGSGVPSAVDLFRFSAAGKPIPDSALSTTPGAYFSYNGGVTNNINGVFYNTLDNGDDYADFLGNCPSDQHVQDGQGCHGHDAGLDITNDGGAEINILNALGYTLPAASTPPVINRSGVVIHGTGTGIIEAGSWVDIYGTSLSQTTRFWNAATEIVNGNLPTSLDSVSVKIDGKPAYVYYISPTQINLQAPDDTASGTVGVTVTTAMGTSPAVTVTLATVSPTFFTFNGKYAAAEIPSPTGYYAPGSAASYDLLGPAGFFSFNTRPVKRGETLELYGTGFGPGMTAVPAGRVLSGATQDFYPVSITIGGVTQTVNAYITGAGVYQINLLIPLTLASGDNALSAIVDGVQTQAGVFVTVQ